MDSFSSLENVLELVPHSQTELLVGRQRGWQQLVDTLIASFEARLLLEKKLSENHSKSAEDLLNPIKAQDDFLNVFPAQSALKKFINEMSDKYHHLSSKHLSTATFIESQTLASLKTMQQLIQQKLSEWEKKYQQLDKELCKDRQLFVQLFDELSTSISQKTNHQNTTHLSTPPLSARIFDSSVRDPWLVNNDIKIHIKHCDARQRSHRTALLSQIHQFKTFETTLLQQVKQTVASFYDWQQKEMAQELTAVQHVQSLVNDLNPSQEWTIFEESNAHILTLGDKPFVDITLLTWDGHEDPVIEVIREGILFRTMNGYFRNNAWKKGNYVLTATGYLHGFDSDAVSNDPDVSLYLPSCYIGPLNLESADQDFFVQEASNGLVPGAKYRFKGELLDQTEFWWGLLSSHAKELKPESLPNSPSLRTTSFSRRLAMMMQGKTTDPVSPDISSIVLEEDLEEENVLYDAEKTEEKETLLTPKEEISINDESTTVKKTGQSNEKSKMHKGNSPQKKKKSGQ